jgi:hypothetical protein
MLLISSYPPLQSRKGAVVAKEPAAYGAMPTHEIRKPHMYPLILAVVEYV